MSEPAKARIFDLAELHARPCPNLLYNLLAVGRLNAQGRLEVPALAADAILSKCPDQSPLSPPSHSSLTGLGDLVAVLAQPIARAIDRMAGTKLKTCGGCAKRRAKLNAILPFQKS
jgi:hypothetical protein